MGSIEDGGSIQTSINNVVPPRHKKETGGNSVTIAPLAGNQLVSTNLFTKGQDLKPIENQKKKRRGLKNKQGILMAKKDEIAEGI